MNCRGNIIGVRGACSSTDEQATLFYYINDLPGISLRKAANIADSESGTGQNILQQSIEQGVKQTQNDIINSLLNVVKFGTVNMSRLSGGLKNGSWKTIATPQGQIIKTLNCSRLQAIYLPYVNVLIENDEDIEIIIEDGGKTTTIRAAVDGGIVTKIALNYKATNNEITVKIGLQGGGSLSVSDAGLNYNGDCCNVCHYDYTNATSTSGDGTSNGLQILVQTICDEDALFCEIARYAAKAAWYASGIWFLEYLLASDRINVYTTYQNEEAADQIVRWSDVYQKELKALNERLPKQLLRLDSCCVECNSSRWQLALP